MSSAPQVTQSQPGGGSILYFGNPPYPLTGYLRAGNDAGVILTYRNFANTADLPGFGIGSGAQNRDFILFAGILAGELTSGNSATVSGVLRPTTAVGGGAGVALGDTFTPFIQVVGEVIQASSHYDGVHTPTQFVMHFVYDGAGEHSELSTQDGSLFFNAGGIHTVVELFNVGSFPGRNILRPYNGNPVGLGDAANPWLALFLAPGTTTLAPLNFDPSGVAPTVPSNGQVWADSLGMVQHFNGVTTRLGGGSGPTDITFPAVVAGSLNLSAQTVVAAVNKIVRMQTQFQRNSGGDAWGLFIGVDVNNGYIAFYAANLWRFRKIVAGVYTDIGTTNSNVDNNTGTHAVYANFVLGSTVKMSAGIDTHSGQLQTIAVEDASIDLSAGTLVIGAYLDHAATDMSGPQFTTAGP